MATFGVSLISNQGGTVESVSIEHKSTFKQLISSEGFAGGTHIYDLQFDISASGKGSNPYQVGSGSTKPSGVSGIFQVTSATNNSKNDDFIGWSMSGTAFQYAVED